MIIKYSATVTENSEWIYEAPKDDEMSLEESADTIKITSGEVVFSLSHLAVVMLILLKNLMSWNHDQNASIWGGLTVDISQSTWIGGNLREEVIVYVDPGDGVGALGVGRGLGRK